jgi:hypothetical protein
MRWVTTRYRTAQAARLKHASREKLSVYCQAHRCRTKVAPLLQVQIYGPGIFVLDLTNWDGNPNAYVELHIDGAIVWEATGTGDNYRKNWNIIIRAKNVRITDDREIAIDIAS